MGVECGLTQIQIPTKEEMRPTPLKRLDWNCLNFHAGPEGYAGMIKLVSLVKLLDPSIHNPTYAGDMVVF